MLRLKFLFFTLGILSALLGVFMYNTLQYKISYDKADIGLVCLSDSVQKQLDCLKNTKLDSKIKLNYPVVMIGKDYEQIAVKGLSLTGSVLSVKDPEISDCQSNSPVILNSPGEVQVSLYIPTGLILVCKQKSGDKVIFASTNINPKIAALYSLREFQRNP